MSISNFKLRVKKIYKFIVTRELLLAIVVTLAIVIIGSVISIENNKIVQLNPVSVSRYTSEPNNKLSFLANWDGVDYINIAKNGYSSSRLTNFFPLYPMIIRLVNKIISSPLITGLIISWVFMVGAIYYYLKVIKLFFEVDDNLEALRATLLFVLFPSALYLMAVYTESLFAFLALGAIYYALKKKYLATALLSALATVTHTNGVFLLILVTLILIEEKEKLKNVLVTLIIGSLGLVGYMVYLWVHFKNPFDFIAAQHDHGWLRHSLLSRLGSLSTLDIILGVTIIITIIYWWKRRKSFAIYSLLYLLIPLVGGQFGGFPRYTLMIFPIQFMLYDYFRSKKLGYQLLLIVFSVGWTYLLLQFAAGYIVN